MRAALALLILVFALTGCSSSSCESAGRKEFQRQHPDYTIVEIVPDGNASGTSYVAHYKKPNDKRSISLTFQVRITGRIRVK